MGSVNVFVVVTTVLSSSVAFSFPAKKVIRYVLFAPVNKRESSVVAFIDGSIFGCLESFKFQHFYYELFSSL